jgi:hypothetical protein
MWWSTEIRGTTCASFDDDSVFRNTTEIAASRESVYRRYAITSGPELREGVDRFNDHVVGTKRGDKASASEKQTA